MDNMCILKADYYIRVDFFSLVSILSAIKISKVQKGLYNSKRKNVETFIFIEFFSFIMR